MAVVWPSITLLVLQYLLMLFESGFVGAVSSLIVVSLNFYSSLLLHLLIHQLFQVWRVNRTLNFSAPSAKLSSSVAIVNVEEVVPALITTLATPVKSVPLTATPLYVKLLLNQLLELEK